MPYWSKLQVREGVIRTILSPGLFYRKSSDFVNKIEPHVWSFCENYRYQGAYASDVFASQYLIVAEKYGFLGQLPKEIRRECVINTMTNQLMEKYESGSVEALDAFLTSTPNGKSTQRILQLFGLEATGIQYTKTEGGNDLCTYSLTVRPHGTH